MKDELEKLVHQLYKSGILYQEAVREFRKTYLSFVLKECEGHISESAKKLGLHRNTLSRQMNELRMDSGLYRTRRPPLKVIPASTGKKALG